jgi:hypothetical protein
LSISTQRKIVHDIPKSVFLEDRKRASEASKCVWKRIGGRWEEGVYIHVFNTGIAGSGRTSDTTMVLEVMIMIIMNTTTH